MAQDRYCDPKTAKGAAMDGAIKIGMGLAISFAWAIVTCELLFWSGLTYR